MKSVIKTVFPALLLSTVITTPVLADGVEWGASMDIEASNGGNIDIAEAEVGVMFPIGNALSAEIVILYESGIGAGIDSASVTYGREDSAISYTVGQIFVPFGNFATAMVSDPLALDLAETTENALQINYSRGAMETSFYLFSGSNSAGGSNLGYGISVGRQADDTQMGFGYISDIGESNNLEVPIGGTLAAHIAGMNLYYVKETETTSFVFEYVMSLGTFQAGEVGAAAVSPNAMNIEYGRKLPLMGKDGIVAIGYQTTTDASDLGLPKSRIATTAAMAMSEHATLSFEYLMDTDYASARSNSWTLQFNYSL